MGLLPALNVGNLRIILPPNVDAVVQADVSTGNEHPTDVMSLVAAVVFLAVAGFGALANGLPSAGWFLAGGLVMAGVLGITATLHSWRTPR